MVVVRGPDVGGLTLGPVVVVVGGFVVVVEVALGFVVVVALGFVVVVEVVAALGLVVGAIGFAVVVVALVGTPIVGAEPVGAGAVRWAGEAVDPGPLLHAARSSENAPPRVATAKRRRTGRRRITGTYPPPGEGSPRDRRLRERRGGAGGPGSY